MENKCLKCGVPTVLGHKYCNMACRSAYLSRLMIRRSKAIKKRYGNGYYVTGKDAKQEKV